MTESLGLASEGEFRLQQIKETWTRGVQLRNTIVVHISPLLFESFQWGSFCCNVRVPLSGGVASILEIQRCTAIELLVVHGQQTIARRDGSLFSVYVSSTTLSVQSISLVTRKKLLQVQFFSALVYHQKIMLFSKQMYDRLITYATWNLWIEDIQVVANRSH